MDYLFVYQNAKRELDNLFLYPRIHNEATTNKVCRQKADGDKECLTHIVRQRCAVSLSASQRLCCLLQNLVVLFGKQSKQAAGETDREKEGRGES